MDLEMLQRGCWNTGRIIDMGDMTKTSTKYCQKCKYSYKHNQTDVWILFTDQIKAWMPGWDVRQV